MNLEISKLSDVPTALDLVKSEVDKAEKAIREEGANALVSGPLKAAEEAIAYAKRLRSFIDKINDLALEWQNLETSIAKATTEARAIIRNAGGTRTVFEPLAPKSNFCVIFPNGNVVSENMANKTLAKAIEIIGPSKIASLEGLPCLLIGGEPLLTHNKADLVKTPAQCIEIPGGWFVNTHSSTQTKAESIKAIAKALKINLKVKIVPGTFISNPRKPTHKQVDITAGQAFPYAVGKVVQAVFPILQNDSRMTSKTVIMLLDQSSSARFKTGGNPVLKSRTGKDNETRDQHGYHRYYETLPLRFFGKYYWLTSQFNPQGITPVLQWLDDLGFSREEILEICAKRWDNNDTAQGKLPL